MLFGEDLLGDLDRGHRLGPAGVERQVHDRLLQFGLGEAVLLGEAQMIPELRIVEFIRRWTSQLTLLAGTRPRT